MFNFNEGVKIISKNNGKATKETWNTNFKNKIIYILCALMIWHILLTHCVNVLIVNN